MITEDIAWLTGMLMSEIGTNRAYARWEFDRVLEICKTIEDFEAVERGIVEGSKKFRKGPRTDIIEINARVEIAKLLKKVAEKKNDLAPKKDLLLPDTIKAPKKGDAYNIMRKIRTC